MSGWFWLNAICFAGLVVVDCLSGGGNIARLFGRKKKP